MDKICEKALSIEGVLELTTASFGESVELKALGDAEDGPDT